MAVTLATADSALKSVYLDVVSDHLNNSVNPFLAAVQKTTSDVWGKDIKKLVMSGYNGGVGAGTEDGDLPSSAGNNYLRISAPLKNLYGVIEISDKAVRASESNAGAFVNLLNAEMDGLMKASSANFGRMLFGDGSGKIADIQTVLDGKLVLSDTALVLPGMKIDIADSTGEFVTGYIGRRVKNVDYYNGTVELEGAALDSDTPTTGYVYAHGSEDNEITGLGAIFDVNREELYGISRTAHSIINPYIEENTGEMTETKLQSLIDDIEMRTGSAPNMILCSFGVRRAIQKAFAGIGRTLPTMQLTGGYNAISYNGIPVVADRFCPKNCAYLLNTDDFCLHQLCDWEWLAGDDGKILRQVPGKPVYTATLVKYAELICNQPNAQTLCKGVYEE